LNRSKPHTALFRVLMNLFFNLVAHVETSHFVYEYPRSMEIFMLLIPKFIDEPDALYLGLRLFYTLFSKVPARREDCKEFEPSRDSTGSSSGGNSKKPRVSEISRPSHVVVTWKYIKQSFETIFSKLQQKKIILEKTPTPVNGQKVNMVNESMKMIDKIFMMFGTRRSEQSSARRQTIF